MDEFFTIAHEHQIQFVIDVPHFGEFLKLMAKIVSFLELQNQIFSPFSAIIESTG